MVQRVKKPSAVMIWGCILADGPGPIHFVEGTMKSTDYIHVLQNVFLPFLERLGHPAQDFVFMQDGAPCHTAKASINCLNTLNVEDLPWPSNSPDLNPIENCWAYLKLKVYSRTNSTIEELKKNIEDVWYNDDDMKQMIQRCVCSMNRRIKDVIKVKGSFTKY